LFIVERRYTNEGGKVKRGDRRGGKSENFNNPLFSYYSGSGLFGSASADTEKCTLSAVSGIGI
jgi:hypothetical protein